MPEAPAKEKKTRGPFVSHTGQTLERSVAFQFALDPTLAQHIVFAKSAGARRACYNHHVGRVKENLDQRSREIEEFGEALTESLDWRKFSLINEFNAFKSGQLDYSPLNGDGTRGLHWHSEVPQDVFECASADAAEALKNWKDSVAGKRKGEKMGFLTFASKNREIPRFRLRNHASSGALPEKQRIRFVDAHHLHFPRIGAVKVFGTTRRVRRMLDAGRFHIYSASFSYRGGRWYVSLSGVAAELHHQQRRPRSRPTRTVGVDLGITSLAVLADDSGEHLSTFEGVKQLRDAEHRLIAAQKALARTTPGSKGRAKARRRLNQLHRRVAATRRHLLHQVSSYLMSVCSRVVLEDLNVKGMVKNHHLAKALSDVSLGELRRQIEYKAPWHDVEVVIADRFYPSSKTCSSCGMVKDVLPLGVRTYHCTNCNLELDRDLNAAINLACYVQKVLAAST
jgi:putative transposase